jgi:hypothetical protein
MSSERVGDWLRNNNLMTRAVNSIPDFDQRGPVLLSMKREKDKITVIKAVETTRAVMLRDRSCTRESRRYEASTLKGINTAIDLDRIVIIFPENVIAGVLVGAGSKSACV